MWCLDIQKELIFFNISHTRYGRWALTFHVFTKCIDCNVSILAVDGGTSHLFPNLSMFSAFTNLQLIMANFTYSRSHAFRYLNRNKSPKLVRTHPIDQVFRDSAPCLSRATTSRKAPKWSSEEAHLVITILNQPYRRRVSNDRLNREVKQ